MTKLEMSKLTNKFYVDMQIDEMLPNEVYEIYIKPNFTTATWRFYQGKHQIVIGQDIFNNIGDFTKKQKAKYLRSFLYHELAHSAWTQKDVKSISEQLYKDSLPFELFNLFEDARIEEKMRLHTQRHFDWFKYEEIDTPTNPVDMFFYLVQSEHNKDELKKLKDKLSVEDFEVFKVVIEFYKKALSSWSSTKVIDVVKEWYEYFPQTDEDIAGIEKEDYLFIKEVISMLSDDEFNELIDGLENLLLGIDASDEMETTRNSIDINNSVQTSLLQEIPLDIAFDKNQRDKLLQKMEKLFINTSKMLSTEIPSKRLNIKRLSTGTTKYYKRRSVEVIDKKKISIILDLSGSMHRTISNMRLMIDVLDKMALKGLIDARLILTGVIDGDANYEVLPMPLKENTIERLVPNYEAEGLDNTLRKNIDLLASSDFVWLFTDGYIDEEALDKHYFHRKNIKTHAMYIGDISCREEMQKSFDFVLCEKTVDGLINQIFYLIKK